MVKKNLMRKAQEMIKTWAPLVVSCLIAIVQLALMPWVRSVNATLAQLVLDERETKTWIGGHHDLVEREKENLRLSIMADVTKLMDAMAVKLAESSRALSLDMRDAGKESQTVSVQVKVLAEQVAAMSQRVTDLRSEMRQAFIDADFRRNAEPKESKGQ